MAKRDYYEVLGVGRDADPDAIKKAYRKLAIQLHPDRNKAADAEDRFKELSEAYAVLSDPEKKSRYDQFGHAGIDNRYSSEDLYRNVNFEDLFQGMGFEDMLGQLFGFGTRRRPTGPTPGRDLQVRHTITLEQAFAGQEARIEYPRLESCARCHGSGAEPGSKVVPCPTCGGQGRVQRMVRTPFGSMSQVSACPDCAGEGSRIERPCQTCGGTGHERKRRSVKVAVPAGIESGQSLRVAGQGEAGNRGGPYGDLYVEVEVRPHERFERDGTELAMELPISMPQAALGAELQVETLDGPATVTVPAGTETGQVVVVRGRGMPALRGRGRGDLHVRLRIHVPDRLSPRAKELLGELAKELGTEVRSKRKRGLFA